MTQKYTKANYKVQMSHNVKQNSCGEEQNEIFQKQRGQWMLTTIKMFDS